MTQCIRPRTKTAQSRLIEQLIDLVDRICTIYSVRFEMIAAAHLCAAVSSQYAQSLTILNIRRIWLLASVSKELQQCLPIGLAVGKQWDAVGWDDDGHHVLRE
jgi:hypothetical protein